MEFPSLSPTAAARVEELGNKYIWWSPAGAHHPFSRQIAQIMRLGSYDDILILEDVVGAPILAEVMRTSAAGWFDDRSWSFWRGRLSHGGEADIPEHAPKRTFTDASVL
jgi:hypothetical protein